MPSATASPCSKRVAEPGLGFERMAEGVAEIEQRAVAVLALVAGDDLGLHRGSSSAPRGVSAAGSRSQTAPPSASSQSKNPASRISPYLTISA